MNTETRWFVQVLSRGIIIRINETFKKRQQQQQHVHLRLFFFSLFGSSVVALMLSGPTFICVMQFSPQDIVVNKEESKSIYVSAAPDVGFILSYASSIYTIMYTSIRIDTQDLLQCDVLLLLHR